MPRHRDDLQQATRDLGQALRPRPEHLIQTDRLRGREIAGSGRARLLMPHQGIHEIRIAARLPRDGIADGLCRWIISTKERDGQFSGLLVAQGVDAHLANVDERAARRLGLQNPAQHRTGRPVLASVTRDQQKDRRIRGGQKVVQ